MNIIDILIVLIAVAGISRGVKVGLFRQGLATVGFFGGLFVGSLLAPHLVTLVSDEVVRAVATLSLTLGLGLLLSGVGEYYGAKLTQAAHELRLSWFDAALGALFEVGVVLVSAWLLAAVAGNLPFYNLGRAIQKSRIIGVLQQDLPPAPDVIAKLEHIINPNGFPKVFLGNEPVQRPDINPAAPADVRAALEKDGPSTVKIEGLGCGGVVLGSGFVADRGIVVTNAHVVAGVRHPTVLDTAGRHDATAIWFDPNLDLAVLRTDGLAGAPLILASGSQPPGSAGVVLGYPGGGSLTASSAYVLSELTAIGRNIYGSGATRRDIYELQTQIEPGNSGGPVVLADGSVSGVVFAKSVQEDQVGYALTMKEVAPAISQAEVRNQSVGTGSCAEG